LLKPNCPQSEQLGGIEASGVDEVSLSLAQNRFNKLAFAVQCAYQLRPNDYRNASIMLKEVAGIVEEQKYTDIVFEVSKYLDIDETVTSQGIGEYVRILLEEAQQAMTSQMKERIDHFILALVELKNELERGDFVQKKEETSRLRRLLSYVSSRIIKHAGKAHFMRIWIGNLDSYINRVLEEGHKLSWLTNSLAFKVFLRAFSYLSFVIYGIRFVTHCVKAIEHRKKTGNWDYLASHKHQMINDLLWCLCNLTVFLASVLSGGTANMFLISLTVMLGGQGIDIVNTIIGFLGDRRRMENERNQINETINGIDAQIAAIYREQKARTVAHINDDQHIIERAQSIEEARHMIQEASRRENVQSLEDDSRIAELELKKGILRTRRDVLNTQLKKQGGTKLMIITLLATTTMAAALSCKAMPPEDVSMIFAAGFFVVTHCLDAFRKLWDGVLKLTNIWRRHSGENQKYGTPENSEELQRELKVFTNEMQCLLREIQDSVIDEYSEVSVSA